MFKLPCPSCGAAVIFRSTASVYAVCSYCKTAAIRQDMNLAAYGSMADVQLDATPLQLNTRGRYDKKSFELIGRLRVGWENGFWNEWVALFDEGRVGWLAEAQGFYAMCFENVNVENLPSEKELSLGQGIRINRNEGARITYQVDDIKAATCLGSEGELPFPVAIGRKTVSVDLSSDHGVFASIEYANDKARLFDGKYVDFDAFNFSFLRELDGW